ncbi:MAG: hypothetical protein JXR03_13855 [Cyclobacteriaceae bacterium]
MILGDIFAYNKNRYFLLITLFVAINTVLHPLTAGYVPTALDGTPNYSSAFATNFVTWGISWNIFGIIIGAGIAAFKKKDEPLRIITAKASLKTIFWIQFVCAILHVSFLLTELFKFLT